MTTSPTIGYTFEEFLARLEQKIDRQFADLKQEIAEVKQEVKELNQKVSDLFGDVKALDERALHNYKSFLWEVMDMEKLSYLELALQLFQSNERVELTTDEQDSLLRLCDRLQEIEKSHFMQMNQELDNDVVLCSLLPP